MKRRGFFGAMAGIFGAPVAASAASMVTEAGRLVQPPPVSRPQALAPYPEWSYSVACMSEAEFMTDTVDEDYERKHNIVHCQYCGGREFPDYINCRHCGASM